MDAGHHFDEEAGREPVRVADLAVVGLAEMAMMLGMGAPVGGDAGADLPADQPVGDAVVGAPVGRQIVVRRLVDEELQIGDGIADADRA